MDEVFGLAGCHWMFIIQGLSASIVGVFILFVLSDHPDRAGWLSPEDKLNYYATQTTDFASLVQIRQRRWAFDPAPSVTAIAISAQAVAIAAMEQSP
jgi:hypothetical protein